jgi:serine/threonine-protein kinase HipA
MKIKRLHVSVPQGHTGLLTKESRFVFNYQTSDSACRASMVMPLRAESYAAGALPAAFAMNRPEGYLLDYLRQRFGKHEILDDMRLLQITGHNQIGRLRYQVEAPTPVRSRQGIPRDELVKSTASDDLFQHLLDTYFDSGISGFQPKVLVPSLDEKSAVSTPDFIVKAAGDDYPFLAQNEYLCMEVARRCGIDVPPFWLSEDGSLFIMERFDLKDGRQYGLEDMAVLMGRSAEEKYRGSYEGIAKIISLFCGDNIQKSLEAYFHYVVVSCLLKNGDAHLKNFSLIYETPFKDVRLSPLYDVVTTSIYEATNPRTGLTYADKTLALKLNGGRSFPLQPDLEEFGRRFCLVKDTATIIDQVREMQFEVLRDMEDRIDPWLHSRVRDAWGMGTWVHSEKG